MDITTRREGRVGQSLAVVLTVAVCFFSGCGSQAPVADDQPQPNPEASAVPSASSTPEAAAGTSEDVLPEVIARRWTGDLDGMIERRLIRVLVPYSKTQYFIEDAAQQGLAYEAGKKFEDQLNARLKAGNLRTHVVFLPMSRDQLFPALLEGRGDLVAAALTVTPERLKQVAFATPTRTNVSEIVVTSADAPALTSVDDLSGHEVFVRRSSSYFESLQALNQRFASAGKKPVVLKEAPETLEDEDLLEMVNASLVKIVIVDDYLAQFWKQIFPSIVLHDQIAVRTGGVIAPAIRPNSPKLEAALAEFQKRYGSGTAFGNTLVQRYLKNTRFAKSATASSEMERFATVIELFRKYGGEYEMDWLLMAAQSYQESRLDHQARSPVGAIGIMQVMPATGKELNVGDITKLEPNIHAGVKYIRLMIDRYYADEPMDRLNKGLFAFASYNAGPARVRQLRAKAAERGLDPNVWFNNVERIASAEIGRETVQYVSNIYKYYIAYQLSIREIEERQRVMQAAQGRGST